MNRTLEPGGHGGKLIVVALHGVDHKIARDLIDDHDFDHS